MGRTLVRRKHLTVDWGDYSFRLRKWRFRHNPRASSIYTQVGPLEVVVWYR